MKLLQHLKVDDSLQEKDHKKHGVKLCKCHIPFEEVVKEAQRHREEGKSLARELSGTVKEFLGTCRMMNNHSILYEDVLYHPKDVVEMINKGTINCS